MSYPLGEAVIKRITEQDTKLPPPSEDCVRRFKDTISTWTPAPTYSVANTVDPHDLVALQAAMSLPDPSICYAVWSDNAKDEGSEQDLLHPVHGAFVTRTAVMTALQDQEVYSVEPRKANSDTFLCRPMKLAKVLNARKPEEAEAGAANEEGAGAGNKRKAGAGNRDKLDAVNAVYKAKVDAAKEKRRKMLETFKELGVSLREMWRTFCEEHEDEIDFDDEVARALFVYIYMNTLNNAHTDIITCAMRLELGARVGVDDDSTHDILSLVDWGENEPRVVKQHLKDLPYQPDNMVIIPDTASSHSLHPASIASYMHIDDGLAGHSSKVVAGLSLPGTWFMSPGHEINLTHLPCNMGQVIVHLAGAPVLLFVLSTAGANYIKKSLIQNGDVDKVVAMHIMAYDEGFDDAYKIAAKVGLPIRAVLSSPQWLNSGFAMTYVHWECCH